MSEAGLLADIVENPEDDTPRLVYADWMQDRGEDNRAELIRVQVEAARLVAGDPRRVDLARRASDLLAEHGRKWAEGLATCCESWQFRRGFIERIRVNGTRAFERESAAIFRRHPIRELCLSGTIESPDVLGRYAEMGRIERLEVVYSVSEVVPLMASPVWHRLRKAKFKSVPDGDAIAEAVAVAPWASGLRSLELSMTQLGRDGLRALTRSPRLEELIRLDVSFNDNLGDASARGVVRSEQLAGLRSLDLTSTELTARGVRALAREEGLARLHTLEMGFNDLGGSGAQALLGSPHLSGLRELHLPNIRAGQRAWEPLAPSFPSLICLDLSQNGIGPEELRLLLDAPGLERLQRVDLGSNPLGREGARLLAAGPWQLASLDLRFDDIGDEGTAALAGSESLRNLETLILHANGIGPEGASALASAPWPRLRLLGLKNNEIGDAGAAALAASTLRLDALELETNPLGPGARAILLQRFGGSVQFSD